MIAQANKFKGIKRCKNLLILFFLLKTTCCFSQGFNHAWLLGNQWLFSVPKARMLFNSNSDTLFTEYRKMPFEGTEANISDANGNFLMSSNGVWIANANNDTMINGSGLNPNAFTSTYPHASLITYGNIIVPFPNDSSKYILFHQTGDSLNNVPSTELYYSVINMNVAGGLGGVDSNFKNIILFHDTISWGLSACKHANGRDWWIVAMKDNSDLIYKILVTSIGIANVTTQNLGIAPSLGAVVQLTFSQDGKKFICQLSNGGTVVEDYLRLLDFDRCSGMFSNPQVIDVSDGHIGWGLAFSSSGKYVYACSAQHIFQINTSTLAVDTVATYDGFCFPNNPWCTTFFNMYLAANGKIYITSGSGVQHIHKMNYPDSGGTACDVQQHSVLLNVWNFRAVPNHPNYYLGCDTTGGCPCYTGIEEQNKHDFKFSILPNPSNGNFKIIYLLPQNKSGTLEIFDITGKCIYKMNLPMWSTLQMINLPELSWGLYQCGITSGNLRVGRKIAIIGE